MTKSLRSFFSVLCPDCRLMVCVDFVVTNHGGCARAVKLRDPILCENFFLSYGDFCFVLRQK